MSLSTGTSVGPYDVLAPIGAGGMGEVYRALDRRLGREVALKVLPSHKLANEDRKQRFIQEAKTASSLNHPNIVTIYDIGSQDGLEYIAMEYVKGRTLDQLIPGKGLRLNETLRLSIAIADALSKAHSAGIVHRDLKPSNIMITEDGQVKLLDFGLAKLVDTPISDGENTMSLAPAPQTVEGTILGTVSYMSPEQAQGFPVDARSDIFSFGALMYEMATGRRAFRCESPIATLSAILTVDPERVSSLAIEAPAELERVIARCLRKQPEKRWQSVKDVKVALEELKEESDSGTLLTGKLVLPPVSAKRGRSGYVIAGICALLLCCGVGAWILSRPSANVAVPQPPAQTVPGVPERAERSRQAPVSDGSLTNDSIIELVKGNVSIPLIAGHIHSSKTNFDLSTGELIRLANAGVPEPVIEMMRNPKASPRQEIARAVALPPAAPLPAPAPMIVEPVPQSAPRIKVPDSTKAFITLDSEDFASEAAVGDAVKFVVRDNVVIDDHLVIAKGAVATGVVSETERKRMFGKGRLMLKLDYVAAVDGQHIRIRPSPVPDSVGRAIPLGKPSEMVLGFPVFVSGPIEVKAAQLQ